MPFLTNADLDRMPLDQEFIKSASVARNAAGILKANARTASKTKTFDVFLSHSYRDAQSLDAKRLLQLKVRLEKFNLSVYVDWIVDGDLSRDRVTPATAARIRQRMDQSKCLMFATSTSSSESKWMPWELGYKDGASKRSAVLPILDNSYGEFRGQEYLGLYPYVTYRKSGTMQYLWIEYPDGRRVLLSDWMNHGKQPSRYAS